jgi:hypothetical protein
MRARVYVGAAHCFRTEVDIRAVWVALGAAAARLAAATCLLH